MIKLNAKGYRKLRKLLRGMNKAIKLQDHINWIIAITEFVNFRNFMRFHYQQHQKQLISLKTQKKLENVINVSKN